MLVPKLVENVNARGNVETAFDTIDLERTVNLALFGTIIFDAFIDALTPVGHRANAPNLALICGNDLFAAVAAVFSRSFGTITAATLRLRY